jgi:hypothetical protein
MAKRNHKKKKTYRRRRIGASASGIQAIAMKAVGIAAGAYAGGMITKAAPTLDPKIMGGGLLIGGVFVAEKFSKGNPLIQGLGYGLAAKGANMGLTSMGLISGIGALNFPIGANRIGMPLTKPVGSLNGVPGSVRGLTAIGALIDN